MAAGRTLRGRAWTRNYVRMRVVYVARVWSARGYEAAWFIAAGGNVEERERMIWAPEYRRGERRGGPGETGMREARNGPVSVFG